MSLSSFKTVSILAFTTIMAGAFYSCKPKGAEAAISGSASQAYVAPGNTMNFTTWYQEDSMVRLASMEFHRDVYSALFLFFRSIQKMDMASAKKPNPC